MKGFSIKKLIGDREFSSASAPMNLVFCFPWTAGFMRMRKHYSQYYKELVVMVKNGIGYQCNDRRQNYLNLKQLYDNPAKIKRIISSWRLENTSFFRRWETGLKKLEDLENTRLAAMFSRYMDEISDLWAAPLAVDLMGEFTESEIFPEFLDALPERYKNFSNDYFAFLCAPEKPSFIARERLSLLKLAYLRKVSATAYKARLAEHAGRYYWIENNYRDIKVLDPSHFDKKTRAETRLPLSSLVRKISQIESARKEVRKRKAKLASKLNLPKPLAAKMHFTALLGQWLDERKEMNLKSNHQINLFLKEFAKRYEYRLVDAYNLLPEELTSMAKTSRKIAASKLSARKSSAFLVIRQPENRTFYFGRQADGLIKEFERLLARQIQHMELKGFIACSGKSKTYKGKVRVVLDPKRSRFVRGEILVASQTRPEYLPLMKKALCIITDEGGITSHAAVVSREMGIPCIIGTRVATQVLKDGDMVEVDADKGIVKKL